MLKLWKENHDSWLQMLHCSYAAGLMAAYSIRANFFMNEQETFMKSQLSTTTTEIPENEKKYFYVIHKNDFVTTPEPSLEKQDDNLMAIHKLAFVFAAIPAFLVGFAFLFMAFYKFLNRSKSRSIVAKCEVEGFLPKEENHSQARCFSFVLTTLLFLFYFVYCTQELIFGSNLQTFATHTMGWTQHQGTMLTYVFLGTLIAGRFIAIFLVKFARLQIYLCCSITATALSVIPLLFATQSHSLVWLVPALFGLSSAAIFASGITWASRYMKVSGSTVALITSATVAGETILPIISAVMSEMLELSSYVYILLIGGCAMMTVYIVMQAIAHKHGPVTKQVVYN